MKKKFLGILLACVMVLSACGKETKESEKQTLQVEEEGTRYTMEEVSLPDPLISENSEGSDYESDDIMYRNKVRNKRRRNEELR